MPVLTSQEGCGLKMSGNGTEQIRTDDQLESLLRQFKANGRTIPVSFRDRLRFLNNPDRYSHLIHPYPAKLLVHIPYFFLANSISVELSELSMLLIASKRIHPSGRFAESGAGY